MIDEVFVDRCFDRLVNNNSTVGQRRALYLARSEFKKSVTPLEYDAVVLRIHEAANAVNIARLWLAS